VDILKTVQGSGDGYNYCYHCGERLTIKECANNQYEGETLSESNRIIRWCNRCVPSDLSSAKN
jgi:hypothetical protein